MHIHCCPDRGPLAEPQSRGQRRPSCRLLSPPPPSTSGTQRRRGSHTVAPSGASELSSNVALPSGCQVLSPRRPHKSVPHQRIYQVGWCCLVTTCEDPRPRQEVSFSLPASCTSSLAAQGEAGLLALSPPAILDPPSRGTYPLGLWPPTLPLPKACSRCSDISSLGEPCSRAAIIAKGGDVWLPRPGRRETRSFGHSVIQGNAFAPLGKPARTPGIAPCALDVNQPREREKNISSEPPLESQNLVSVEGRQLCRENASVAVGHGGHVTNHSPQGGRGRT